MSTAIKHFLLMVCVFGSAQLALGDNLYFVHTDHLGTPVVITDGGQNVVWQGDKLPFGETGAPINQIEFNVRFPGQYYDQESGLHYNYFRDYDPQTGRYVQSDPIGLKGGPNTYAYALGNPVIYADPLGLDVYICTRPINISWVPSWASQNVIPNHTWIKTDTVERGMGGNCAVPGQGCADIPYVTQVEVKDHSGQSSQDGASCEKMNNVNEQCVNDGLPLGKPLGTWNGFNQCQSFAWSLVTSCRTGPQI